MKECIEGMIEDSHPNEVVIKRAESSGEEHQEESSGREEEDELEEKENQDEDVENNDNQKLQLLCKCFNNHGVGVEITP